MLTESCTTLPQCQLKSWPLGRSPYQSLQGVVPWPDQVQLPLRGTSQPLQPGRVSGIWGTSRHPVPWTPRMVPRLGCQAGPSWDQSLSPIPIPGSSPCPWILGKRDFQGQTWLKSSGLCRDLLKGGVCPGPSSLPVLSQGPPAPQPRGDSCSTWWFYRALAPLPSQATLIQWFAPQGGSGLLRGKHGSPQARGRRDNGQ